MKKVGINKTAKGGEWIHAVTDIARCTRCTLPMANEALVSTLPHIIAAYETSLLRRISGGTREAKVTRKQFADDRHIASFATECGKYRLYAEKTDEDSYDVLITNLNEYRTYSLGNHIGEEARFTAISEALHFSQSRHMRQIWDYCREGDKYREQCSEDDAHEHHP